MHVSMCVQALYNLSTILPNDLEGRDAQNLGISECPTNDIFVPNAYNFLLVHSSVEVPTNL